MKLKIENQTISELKSLEWLETNGLGAWAMGTLSGINTRKYHSWLTASYNPPTDRVVLIPKLTESLSNAEEYHELDTNEFGDHIHPHGWTYLKEFEKEYYPKWTFKTPLGDLKRSLIMPNGINCTIINYNIKAKKNTNFHIRLYHIFRDIHSLYNQNGYLFDYETNENQLIITEKTTNHKVYIHCSHPTKINLQPEFYNNISYSLEKSRGYDAVENWMTAGYLDISLDDDPIYLVLSTEYFDIKKASTYFNQEVKRREKLTEQSNSDFEKELTLAADQFIVARNQSKSIIAGYPWFTDWGRDTMISLEGLCLSTKRFEDAYQILVSFKNVVQHGLIPNRFVETGSVPEYNTIDATLWFFVALYQYHKESKQSIEEFYPTIKTILNNHIEGTLYNIKMDPKDALLSGGESGWQLTWMDAKLGDVVVTPRRGKAVEINALWYNALMIGDYFSKDYDFKIELKKLASKCKNSFNLEFIKPNGALYDVIGDDFKDESIRPNQAFAGSLPFKVVNIETAQEITKEIEKYLLTPHGLRTLNKEAEGYRGFCNGDLHSRDYAYHQGTVWMWLWGAYAETKLYANAKNAKEDISKQLKLIEKHFYKNGICSLSEVFDGDDDHEAGGCPAQAWSVAEVLRILRKN